jgi:hypothetical protein
VISAVGEHDETLARELGATPFSGELTGISYPHSIY